MLQHKTNRLWAIWGVKKSITLYSSHSLIELYPDPDGDNFCFLCSLLNMSLNDDQRFPTASAIKNMYKFVMYYISCITCITRIIFTIIIMIIEKNIPDISISYNVLKSSEIIFHKSFFFVFLKSTFLLS